MTCNTSSTATLLFDELTAGESITLPDIDLSSPDFDIPNSSLSTIHPISDTSLTNLSSKNGTFDLVVSSIKSLLEAEYKSNRISGAEYSKAFIALIEAALNNSVNFLLQRDTATLQAERAKVELAASRIAAFEAKVRLATATLLAKNQAVELAINKIKLALIDAEYCTAKYNLENMLPETLALQVAQKETAQYQLNEILPKQALLTDSQVASTNADTFNKLEQNQLIKEQVETARAATLDTRRDGNPIAGSVSVEKSLQLQQKLSFELSSKLNAAKMFADAWTVSKTVDNAIEPPTAFANPSLESILQTIKTAHNLGS